MSTEINGSTYSNHPTEDVFAKFAKTKTGHVILTPEGALERAKIAHHHGLMVDPVTGKGFWATGISVQSGFNSTKKNGGIQ
jgi:hypothetical protein